MEMPAGNGQPLSHGSEEADADASGSEACDHSDVVLALRALIADAQAREGQ